MAAPIHLAALLALLPAAANPSLLVEGEWLAVTLCGGGTMSIPLDNPLPGSQASACCSKGCREDSRRKQRGQPGIADPL